MRRNGQTRLCFAYKMFPFHFLCTISSGRRVVVSKLNRIELRNAIVAADRRRRALRVCVASITK